MTEQHAPSGAEEPAPPSTAAADEHAGAKRPQNDAQPARAPLGEWRGPAFWMACGALLAGLAGAAAVLVERAAVERDMMAVAATLPPAVPPSSMATGAPGTAQVPAARPPGDSALAAPPANSQVMRPLPAPAARQPAAPNAKPPVRRHAVRRPPAAVASRIQGAPRATALKPYTKSPSVSPRKRVAIPEKYAEVFKRCPAPGMPGAVQCRRDICNGAEGKGPACKPYLSKRR